MKPWVQNLSIFQLYHAQAFKKKYKQSRLTCFSKDKNNFSLNCWIFSNIYVVLSSSTHKMPLPHATSSLEFKNLKKRVNTCNNSNLKNLHHMHTTKLWLKHGLMYMCVCVHIYMCVHALVYTWAFVVPYFFMIKWSRIKYIQHDVSP